MKPLKNSSNLFYNGYSVDRRDWSICRVTEHLGLEPASDLISIRVPIVNHIRAMWGLE